MYRRILLAAVSLCVLMAVSGCLGGSVEIQRDSELERSLRQLSGTAGSARLADLTDFPWDTMHVFTEGAKAEEVNGAAGVKVIREGSRYYDAGNLLIFTSNGEFVSAISMVPDVLVTDGQRTWDNTARLEPRGSRTPVALRLVES